MDGCYDSAYFCTRRATIWEIGSGGAGERERLTLGREGGRASLHLREGEGVAVRKTLTCLHLG